MISSGSAFSDWFLTDGVSDFLDDDCVIRSGGSTSHRHSDEEANVAAVREGASHDEGDGSVTFRRIGPQDRVIIQKLHEQWFPVLYHDDFYDDLAADRPGQFGGPLYSCLAVRKRHWRQQEIEASVDTIETGSLPLSSGPDDDEIIIASVIGTFVPAASLTESLQRLLFSDGRYTRLFYLMTLGCQDKHRKEGWGTTMVERSLRFAEHDPECGGVYLHVITFNHAAIRLYEKLGFYRVQEIVNYYSIGNKKYNCYLYAKYLNGNRGHLGFLNVISEALASLWKQFVTVPMNYLIDATGASNSSRLM